MKKWNTLLNRRGTGNHEKFPTLPDGSRDIIRGWNHVEAWKQMEALLSTGKVKAIGVCNVCHCAGFSSLEAYLLEDSTASDIWKNCFLTVPWCRPSTRSKTTPACRSRRLWICARKRASTLWPTARWAAQAAP